MGGRDRDAAGSWPRLIGEQMKEDRASSASDAWMLIVIENHDHVIDMVPAPQFLVAIGAGRMPGTIVQSAFWIVAPDVGLP